jgi:hypothetical protein
VELRNSIQSRLAAELPATLTFDYPTISALASYLAANHSSGTASEMAAAEGNAASISSCLSHESILAELQGIVAGMLGAEVAPDTPLMEAGLDSLGKCQSDAAVPHPAKCSKHSTAGVPWVASS